MEIEYLKLISENRSKICIHAVKKGSGQALCGRQPSVRSRGWASSKYMAPDCEKCKLKLEGKYGITFDVVG